jgi:hypothetical protein
MQIQWKKIGGGSLRWRGQIIKPGQIFIASPEDIPEAFRGSLVSLGPVEDSGLTRTKGVAKGRSENVPAPRFTLRPRDSDTDTYDIVNAESGKPINEQGMSKDDAEKLLAELTS